MGRTGRVTVRKTADRVHEIKKCPKHSTGPSQELSQKPPQASLLLTVHLLTVAARK